jgi:hypothetical protein
MDNILPTPIDAVSAVPTPAVTQVCQPEPNLSVAIYVAVDVIPAAKAVCRE